MDSVLGRVVLAVLAVITSFLLIIPVATQYFIDYGHPKKIQWEVPVAEKTAEANNEKKEVTDESNAQEEEKKESRKNALISYSTFSEDLERFYDIIHAPLRPAIWLVIIFAFLIAVITIFLTEIFSDDSDSCCEFFAASAFMAQLAFLVLGACVFIWNANHFDVREALRATIADEGLRDAALKRYSGIQVGFSLLPLAIFVASDALILVILLMMQFIADRVNKIVLSREIYFQDENIIIRKDGMVEKFVVAPKIRWLFIPVLFIHSRRIIWRMPLNTFLQKIIQQFYLTPLEEFKKRILENSFAGLSGVARRSIDRLLMGLNIKLQTGIADSIQKITKDSQASSFESSCRLIGGVSDATLSRFRQDFAAGIREKVDRHLEGFEQDIFREVRETFFNGNKSASASDASPVYPEGTKYYWTDGAITHVVIEQKPQLRTVNFSRSFFKNEEKSGKKRPDGGSIQLAFPYVVFAFTLFPDTEHSRFYVFYRNKPLETLKDSLFRANLPNTFPEGGVCMGDGFRRFDANSIAERVGECIAYFWHSTFNTDLASNNYIPSKSLDTRIQDIWSWEEASKNDPLFVLRVPWLAASVRLSGIFGAHRDNVLAHQLKLFDKCVQNVLSKKKAELGKFIREHSLSVRVEGLYPDAIIKEIEMFLKSFSYGICHVFVSMVECSAGKIDGLLYERFDRHVKDVVLEVLQKDFSDCVGSAKSLDVNVEKIFHDAV